MQENKFDIEKFLDLNDYEVTRNSRRKGARGTQEFFTPYSIVSLMCSKISDTDWSDPSKTFLEPCMGNGQFVIYMIYNRLQHGIDWRTALSTLFGVELMQDNVDETKQRIMKLLEEMGISYDKEEAKKIVDHNLVCANFFEWDFENWKPNKDI